MSQQNTTVQDPQDKIYPHPGIDEVYLQMGKPLYAGVYDNTGVVRLSNIPVTPRLTEDPDAPHGKVLFETFLDTPEQRHWLTHLLFEANEERRWFGESPRQYVPVAPINEQAEMHHIDTKHEHSLLFERTNGEQVTLMVGMLPIQEVQFFVSTEIEEGVTVYHEKVTLSLKEAHLLRDLLNKPEVAAILDQEA